MTRFGHFLRGNRLRIADVAEYSTVPEKRLRAIEAGADMRINELYHLVGACSYLLGRRVQVTELFGDTKESI